MIRLFKQKSFRKILSTLFAVSLLLSVIFLPYPKQAQATVPTWDEGASGLILTNYSSKRAWSVEKEHSFSLDFLKFDFNSMLQKVSGLLVPSWDSLLYTLGKIELDRMKNSTFSWIKTGFREGSPMFVTNPNDFLTETANRTSAIFVQDLGEKLNNDPGFFCGRFAPRIIQNLFGGYSRRDYFDDSYARCTITDVVDDVQYFYDDFNQGGWNAWFELNKIQNNPGGFYLMTLQEEQTRADVRVADDASIAKFANGFLDVRKCAEYGPDGKSCRKYITETPGKAVEQRLAQATGIDFTGMNLADEVNEIMSSLIDLAIQTTLKEGLSPF